MENLFDFANDFNEEEEAVFSYTGTKTGRMSSTKENTAATPKGGFEVKTVVKKSKPLPEPVYTGKLPEGTITQMYSYTGTGKPLEVKMAMAEIIAKYQAGTPVRQILREYGISSYRFYEILKTFDVPLKGGFNVSSAKDSGYTFISAVADKFNLTDANVRGYCQILEKEGYNFKRIRKTTGGHSARIFTEKDIDTIGRMIDNMKQGFTMVESAKLSIYNNDVEPPKVTVRLEGETLYLNIEHKPEWTAKEINVVIDLTEEGK